MVCSDQELSATSVSFSQTVDQETPPSIEIWTLA